MASKFLSRDGFLCVEEFTALAREIDKVATKEGLKPGEIHFAGKVIPKYDSAKAKAGGDAFTKKRAVPVKVRSRMPAAGSRVKMVVMFVTTPSWMNCILSSTRTLMQHWLLSKLTTSWLPKLSNLSRLPVQRPEPWLPRSLTRTLIA